MALGLAACLGAPAMAQGQGGRGGFGMMGGGGGLALLSNKGVQKELKLSDEQIDKAEKAATESMGKMRERFQDLQGLDADARREKQQSMMREMAAESKKVTDEILKPEQAKRFAEISLQVRGAQALSDPEVQSKLKLTDEQKNKLKDMASETQSKMQELRSGLQDDREGTMQKIQAYQKENATKTMALLTDDQKKTWKDMTGEPFEYTPEARRPRNNN
jgi:hypothetical protein